MEGAYRRVFWFYRESHEVRMARVILYEANLRLALGVAPRREPIRSPNRAQRRAQKFKSRGAS